MGRPTKLTPELLEKISGYVEAGNFVDIACQACGINRSTYYRWKNRGETNNKGIYHDFCNTIKKAEAVGEVSHVEKIREGKSGWQSSAWWLERRFPDRWGKVDRVDLTSKGEGINRSIKLEELSNDDLNRIADILRTSQAANADRG